MIGMTLAGVLFGAVPASATSQITCSGNGPSTENGNPVAGAVTFILDTSVSPHTLTLVLVNTTAGATPNQGGVLTGMIYDIGNNSAVLSPNQSLLTPTLSPGSFLYDSSGVLTPVLTSKWTSKINPGTAGHTYGIATTGFGGYFDAGGITGSSNYGMVSTGTFPNTFPQDPYVQNSLTFQFTTPASFTVADIKNVALLFGTQPGTLGPVQMQCEQKDYGDAPDTKAGTALGTPTTPPDYQTTSADGGPSHLLGKQVFLGTTPDGDSGLLQNVTATADDTDNLDDEDGIDLKNLPTILTTDTIVKMNVKATNLTQSPAVLACWIDFNRNGIFGDVGEMASATVNGNVTAGIVPLTFTGFAAPQAGPTAMRCRITTEWADASAATPIGAVGDGEVEDYMVNGIYAPCNTGIVSLPAAPTAPNHKGVQITLTSSSSPFVSVQCQKLININAAAITFNPVATTGPTGTPPSWTFASANPLVLTAQRADNAQSSTIACTATDSAGNVCAADPWNATGLRLRGSESLRSEVTAVQTLKADAADSYVTVENGQPGVAKLEISVNGTKFKLNGLNNGEKRTLCIGSAMEAGDDNIISLVAKGRPGGSVEVMGQPLPDGAHCPVN